MKTVRIASWSNVLATRTRLSTYRPGVFDTGEGPFIPRGSGRSFGDSAYVSEGDTVCCVAGALKIDRDSLSATCNAAVYMGDLQKAVEREDLYCPVFGGTQWVTAGGAVASDIHSKANPDEGSCGNAVEALKVVTADGVERSCSREQLPELFAATIGGMGMTGFITEVVFRLQPARPLGVQIRGALFENVDEMRRAFDSARGDLQVVEWVDLTRDALRGVVWHASYAEVPVVQPQAHTGMWLPRVRVFYRPTVRVMEYATLKVASTLDMAAHRRRFHYGSLHERFFKWNQLFGRRGFIEYHFCIPDAALEEAFAALARLRRKTGAHLFFGAGKRFGPVARAGMMSFPMDGWGINFQAPESHDARRMLVQFTDVVAELGGRIYFAKDSVAAAPQIRRMYSRIGEWQAVLRSYDPRKKIQSDLSRRLDFKPW